MADDRLKSSIEVQKMINDLISNAANLNSQYPMKAIRAKNKVLELKEALNKHFGKLESNNGLL